VYVTDSIALEEKASRVPKLELLTVADMFGEAISRAFQNQSISSLFDVDKG
jgi:phosphoribosylpyrophosphate synthetase